MWKDFLKNTIKAGKNLVMSDVQYIEGKEPHPRETRVVFKNVDRQGWDPSMECYLKDGGYVMLKKGLKMTPDEVREEVKTAGLRGRGGAGFPAGLKWRFARNTQHWPKYVIFNAEEGDPGAFMDRSVLEGDPHALIEGMIIAGYAIGAASGYIY